MLQVDLRNLILHGRLGEVKCKLKCTEIKCSTVMIEYYARPTCSSNRKSQLVPCDRSTIPCIRSGNRVKAILDYTPLDPKLYWIMDDAHQRDLPLKYPHKKIKH
jgi:hypothetical protein